MRERQAALKRWISGVQETLVVFQRATGRWLRYDKSGNSPEVIG